MVNVSSGGKNLFRVQNCIVECVAPKWLPCWRSGCLGLTDFPFVVEKDLVIASASCHPFQVMSPTIHAHHDPACWQLNIYIHGFLIPLSNRIIWASLWALGYSVFRSEVHLVIDLRGHQRCEARCIRLLAKPWLHTTNRDVNTEIDLVIVREGGSSGWTCWQVECSWVLSLACRQLLAHFPHVVCVLFFLLLEEHLSFLIMAPSLWLIWTVITSIKNTIFCPRDPHTWWLGLGIF